MDRLYSIIYAILWIKLEFILKRWLDRVSGLWIWVIWVLNTTLLKLGRRCHDAQIWLHALCLFISKPVLEGCMIVSSEFFSESSESSSNHICIVITLLRLIRRYPELFPTTNIPTLNFSKHIFRYQIFRNKFSDIHFSVNYIFRQTNFSKSLYIYFKH